MDLVGVSIKWLENLGLVGAFDEYQVQINTSSSHSQATLS